MAQPGLRQLGETLTQGDAGTAQGPAPLDTDRWWQQGDQLDQQMQGYARVLPTDPQAKQEVEQFDNQVANAQRWPGDRLPHSETPKPGFQAPNYHPKVEQIDYVPSRDGFLSTVRQLENSGDQAVSPKGAAGRYQIMPETAKGLGYDPQDRLDPAKNEAMAGALRDQLAKQYGGDRDAMLVAYNAGPKMADKWLAADRDNSVLPQETQNYLQRAAAIQTTPQLPAVFERAAQARAAGYSWDDIDSYLLNARTQAQGAGYSDDEINGYLGLPQPKDMATARGQLLQRGYKPEEVDGFIKALSATAQPTAGDVLKTQGWSTESATQFFGQKFVNGVSAALELRDGKPKSKDEADSLKSEVSSWFTRFAQRYGEEMLGTAEAEQEQGKTIGKFGQALGQTGEQLINGLIDAAKIPGDVAAGKYGADIEDPRFQGAAREFAANFGALKPVVGLAGRAETAAAAAKAVESPPRVLPTVKDALDAAVSVSQPKRVLKFQPPSEQISPNWDSTGGPSFSRMAPTDLGYVSKHVSAGNITQARRFDQFTTDLGSYKLPDGRQVQLVQDGKRAIEAWVPREDGEYKVVGTAKKEIGGDALEHLVVSPEYRGQGLATKLTDLAEDRLNANPYAAKDRSEAGAAFLEARRQKDIADSQGADLNTAFQAIGQHYLETGTHPIAAAAKAQSDPSLAAKLAGKLLGDESGSFPLGPQAPEFPYPRDAPDLPINSYSIQQKNPSLGAQVVDELRKAFAPYNRGPEAKDTAAIIRHGLAQENINSARTAVVLRDFGRAVGELTPAQKMDYVHAFESGEVPELFKGTPLGDLAAKGHELLDQRFKAMEKRGITDSYIENYLPHLWRDPDAAKNFFTGGRSMAGPRQFTKQRVYATYKEGMANGLVPRTTNPIEIMSTGLHQMDRAINAHDMMTEIVNRGLARTVPFGEGLRPGEQYIDDAIARPKIAGQEGNRYAAPEKVATLINRTYKPSVFAGSTIWRMVKGANNLMNMAQLGFSGFHAGFVSAEAFYSQLALSAKQLSRFDLGEAAEAGKTFIGAPAAPIRNAVLGWKVWNQALGLKDYGPEMQTLADKMVAGGFRFSMDKDYAGTAVGSFWRSFHGGMQAREGLPYGEMTVRQDLAQMFQDAEAMAKGTIIPAQVRFAGMLIPRIMQTIMGPLMEYYVPAMKAGAMANLLRDELRVNPTMDLMTLRQTAGRLSASVDDRLGELAYDNIFWNKTAKDLAQMGVRSPGWNIGSLRQFLGGAKDLTQGRKITAGEFRQISDAAAYIIALPVGSALISAIHGFLYGTWNSNWGLREYFGGAPTGGKADKRGDPEQVSPFGYMKDAIEWIADPVHTALNKKSPVLDLAINWANNETWNGAGISDPRPGKETTAQKVGDYAKDLFERFEPIMLHSQIQPGSEIPYWYNFFGAKPSPHTVREFFGEKPTKHEVRVMREKGAQKQRMERERQ